MWSNFPPFSVTFTQPLSQCSIPVVRKVCIFSVNADVMNDLSPVALISAVMKVFASRTATAADLRRLSRPFAVCVEKREGWGWGWKTMFCMSCVSIIVWQTLFQHPAHVDCSSAFSTIQPLLLAEKLFKIKVSISAVLWVLN